MLGQYAIMIWWSYVYDDIYVYIEIRLEQSIFSRTKHTNLSSTI